ncbi:MAG: hypothetical protein ACI9BH_002098 [Paracoccaceae bacterium]|jgi:hypothetical protein
MISSLRHPLRRFRRSEKGSATVEFAITFPIMLLFLLSGIELSFVNLRHSMLERAVDLTVRDIRLGTGTAPQHDEIKNMICVRAGFIDNCADNLRLEMIQVDPRNWTAIPAEADCTDKSVEVAPVRAFVNGLDNELMILRACAKFDPVFPTSGLGADLASGTGGQYALVSTTAFVQEPQ